MATKCLFFSGGTWLKPSSSSAVCVSGGSEFKNHIDTTQATSYSSISRRKAEFNACLVGSGIGSTLQAPAPNSTAVSSSSVGNFRDRNFGDGAESVQDTSSSADNFHGSALNHAMFAGGGGGVNTASSSSLSIKQQQQNAIQNTAASLVPTGNG